MELEFKAVLALEKRKQQIMTYSENVFLISKIVPQRILNNQVESITNSRNLHESIS